jgi:hypothetical protein
MAAPTPVTPNEAAISTGPPQADEIRLLYAGPERSGRDPELAPEGIGEVAVAREA